jgi:hypothetical protein
MRSYFLFVTFLIVSLQSFTQLDPFYFGTYIDDDFTAGFTIYTMDEVEADCFLVEFERYENYETVFNVSGFGHCEGENGKLEIQFEDAGLKTQVSFSVDEYGMKNMNFHNGEFSGIIFREYEDIVPEDGIIEDENTGEEIGDEGIVEETGEEIYFSRDDGSELILYSLDDGNSLGFTIYYASTGDCEGNGIDGLLSPMNEEMSLFEFTGNDKCRIEFQISTDSINLIEENCSEFHGEQCGDWNGLYILNR